MIFSVFVPISDIHKICKWMNLPNFGKYVQITFCLCMYSWNFKLWTFCMGTLYGNFVLLICVSILCGSLILFEGSVWALCVVIVRRFFFSILYWFCVFYTWIQSGFCLHIMWENFVWKLSESYQITFRKVQILSAKFIGIMRKC